MPGHILVQRSSHSLGPFRSRWLAAALTTCVVLAGGCKEEELPVAGELGDACTPSDDDPCAAGLVCEARAGGSGDDAYICAGPVELRGMVIDALDESPIPDARILALDDTGAPISDVAISDADGRYTLPIAIPRDSDGNPATALTLTLSGSALDYQIYPSGLQPAFPVSTAEVQQVEDDPDVDGDEHLSFIENASTTVALIPLENPSGFTVSGRVATVDDDVGGTLVVAEGSTGTYTVADRSGAFTLFNVASGANTVRGYRGGLQIVPEDIDIDADLDGVVLELAGEGTGTVSGSVNIVNAPCGGETSVVLIPSALFSDALEFGPVPYGLRAPGPGIAPNVSSGWTIDGVPAGTYKVIASLENDCLVRDPDTSIAGTEILEITVAADETVDIQDSFKVTEALEIVGPGADGPEVVSGGPVFEFADDSSEDQYVILVHDALGNEIWTTTIDGVSGSATVTVDYAGPALTSGMYYRFQATSLKDGVPKSRTEDLRGVFVIP